MAKPLKVRKVSGQRTLNEAAVRILRTRLREYYSHITDTKTAPTPEQLHDLRISGKRLRYSAESLRDIYPDRLSLLIDLLKRGQDILGEIQDCIVYGEVVETDLNRLKRRKPESKDIPALESLVSDYKNRRREYSAQFLDIWKGLAHKGIQKSMRQMVSKPEKRPPAVTEEPPE